MFIYQLYIQVVQFIVSLKHQKKAKGVF